MIRLSLGAEFLKLTRQRGALFWGFLLVPLCTILLDCLLGTGPAVPLAGGAMIAIQPLHAAARAMGAAGNPIAQLFYAIGASAVFAVEYRHSGWRHIVPRASRASLLVSKLVAFAIFAGLSLVLVMGGSLLVSMIAPIARGAHPIVADADLPAILALGLCFLISLGELVTLAAMVALLATITRSAMAAIIAPFLLSLTASSIEAYLGGAGPAIPLPTFAGDALRAWAIAMPVAPVRPALIGLATLIGWAGASFGSALIMFDRQDLVSE